MPNVSVVTCAYSEDRWDDLVVALDSVRRQTVPPSESILVIDHNDRLLERARRAFPDVRVEPNARARGASGARNTACDLARGDVIAFLDDDASAEECWLQKLVAPFDDPTVLGVGGKAIPAWPVRRPIWFPEEFDWVVGCSYLGMPTSPTTVRNVIGTNMSVRRDAMMSVGGFREGFGNVVDERRGAAPPPRLSTGEETEFCIRAQVARPGSRWLYTPDAKAIHRVPPYRTTVRYFLSRCWIEGRGKATLAEITGSAALTSERGYASTTLPRGVRRGTVEALRGRDLTGLLRAAAIVIGLAVTTVGYVAGRMRSIAGIIATTSRSAGSSSDVSSRATIGARARNRNAAGTPGTRSSRARP